LIFDFCTLENCLTELVGFKIASHVTQNWLSQRYVAEGFVVDGVLSYGGFVGGGFVVGEGCMDSS